MVKIKNLTNQVLQIPLDGMTHIIPKHSEIILDAKIDDINNQCKKIDRTIIEVSEIIEQVQPTIKQKKQKENVDGDSITNG